MMYETLELIGAKLLHPSGPLRFRTVFCLFLILTALILTVTLAPGPYPVTVYGADTAHMLAQGDRLVRGSRPYVDYYSLHGPFYGLLAAVGVKAFGISMRAVLATQALGALLFGALMLKISISRLHAFWALLLSVGVEMILLSFTPIGDKAWREFSPAMWYNALSFCIMAIVFLYLLLPTQSSRPVSRRIDAGIAAFCLAVSFHTKMSFFAPLTVLVVFGMIIFPMDRRMRVEGWAVVVIAVLMIVGLMQVLRGSLTGYLRFLASTDIQISPFALGLRYIQYTVTPSLFLVGMLLAGWMAHQTGLWRAVWREWFLSVLMFGTVLATVSTCHQMPDTLPFLGVILLGVITATAIAAGKLNRTIASPLATTALLIATILLTHEPKNSAMSWISARIVLRTMHSQGQPMVAEEVRTPPVNHRVDAQLFQQMPRSWVDSVQSALDLLKQGNVGAGDILFTATETDGVTMLTDANYARGQSPWWHYGLAARPEDGSLMDPNLTADAQWILRDLVNPSCWRYLTHHRGGYIDDNFVPIGENDRWRLYRRRDRTTRLAPKG